MQIGFPWDPAEARWMRRYHQLTEAITRHGGPRNLPPGSPEATWLEGQHLAHHHGKLPDDKIALLEQAGITIRRPDRWMAAYQALMDFKAGHGHLRIPDGLHRRRRDRPVRLAARPARPAQSRPAHRGAGTPAGRGRVLLGPRRRSLGRPLPGSSRLETRTRQPRPPPQAPPEGMAVPAAEAPRHRPASRLAGPRSCENSDALTDPPPENTRKPQ